VKEIREANEIIETFEARKLFRTHLFSVRVFVSQKKMLEGKVMHGTVKRRTKTHKDTDNSSVTVGDRSG
jgi:hypothetical protein